MIGLLALLATGAAGQKSVNTPFARYGIGNLELQGPFRMRAMGGISSGIRDNLTLNYLTPSSYSSTDTASFLFDFGIDYTVAGMKGDDLGFVPQVIKKRSLPNMECSETLDNESLEDVHIDNKKRTKFM